MGLKFFISLKEHKFAIASWRRLMLHYDFIDTVGAGTARNAVQLTNGFTWVINAYYLLYLSV